LFSANEVNRSVGNQLTAAGESIPPPQLPVINNNSIAAVSTELNVNSNIKKQALE
jgi:hypothetical protein